MKNVNKNLMKKVLPIKYLNFMIINCLIAQSAFFRNSSG